MANYNTTPQKRFKILYLLVLAHGSDKLDKLLKELENLAEQMDANHPEAMEVLCYFEDNVVDILSGDVPLTVAELN